MKITLLIASVFFAAACAVETEEYDPYVEDEGKADVFSIGTDGETIDVDGYLEWPVELTLYEQPSVHNSFTCVGSDEHNDCNLVVELIVPFEERQIEDLRQIGFIPEYPVYMPFVVVASMTISMSVSDVITYNLSLNYDHEADDGSYFFAWSRYFMDWEGGEVTRRDEDFDSRVEDYFDNLVAGETRVGMEIANATPQMNIIARIAWR